MSNDKDFAVNAVGSLSNTVQVSKKPSYLITLDPNNGNKIKKHTYFISIDRPDFLNGFIQVKGFFSDDVEDEIINNISSILTSLKKELICEMMFPWHRICSVRSLVFNAVKTQTFLK